MITGGPCSGKTTTVNLLRDLGYRTTIEDARHYLDLQRANGKTVEQVRRNQKKFQLKVLNMQIAQELALKPDEIVFLDRAIPDARAYSRYLKIPEAPKLGEALRKISYKKVFILDRLPLVNDYARREDETAQRRIHELLIDVYSSLPFPIVRVPVMPAKERVQFILKHL